MENQPNVETLRKELRNLAFIQSKVESSDLVLGPLARKALHDKMLSMAFQLQEATQ